MKILQNMSAKKIQRQLSESLTEVFSSNSAESLQRALSQANNALSNAENNLAEKYLFPDGTSEEEKIFSRNVWLNIDTIKFLNHFTSGVISDNLIFTIGSFYTQADKHQKMLFANFILDGLLMARNSYKDNWLEYTSRYYDIQNNIFEYVEKYMANPESWKRNNKHHFNIQYPLYYAFTAAKEYNDNDELVSLTHYDRALVKLALLSKSSNQEKAEGYIKKAIDRYGFDVVTNGEMKHFLSPLNAMIYETDEDRLEDYSFITNTIEQIGNAIEI